eukprot:353466-Chlamydomonas_euryale.AAC.8
MLRLDALPVGSLPCWLAGCFADQVVPPLRAESGCRATTGRAPGVGRLVIVPPLCFSVQRMPALQLPASS